MPPTDPPSPDSTCRAHSGRVGIVAIGRNEGERFRRCVTSLEACGAPIVYVDSASTDGSAEWARSRGCLVVELDMAQPFTAARARNAGLERLLLAHPGVELVQFVDGDCEVVAGWIETAVRALDADPGLAAVCGRLRELRPEQTIYNRLCDIEWNTPVGPAAACGGIAMYRVRAFLQVGGFDAAIIAGEEPELCVRLRQRGWAIYRLDAEMALHDAAMERFGQWWTRAVRAGHCFAEGFALHGAPPERLWLRKNLSILFWALALPVTAVLAAFFTGGLGLALLLLYPASLLRSARASRRRGLAPYDARLYAGACMLANFAGLAGQARYALGRVTGRRSRIIEYKGKASPSGTS
jgi:GT2 family glycosyltransferase